MQSKQNELREQLAIVQRRMAMECNDDRYDAIATEFDRLRDELRQTEEEITARQAAAVATLAQTPEQQVESALTLLDNVARITGDQQARAEINPLLQRMGIWIGLRFVNAVKGKKRIIQRLQSGLMTFGDRGLPVRLFGRDNAEAGTHDDHDVNVLNPSECVDKQDRGDQRAPSGSNEVAQTASSDGDSRCECRPISSGDGTRLPAGPDEQHHSSRPSGSQPEGISITKVSRGNRRLTFPNEFSGSRMLWLVLPQPFEFVADTFFCPVVE